MGIELLKKYATFLLQHHFDEVASFYHLNNLENIGGYANLNEVEISDLIKKEIHLYLSSISKGDIKDKIQAWISDLKENKLPGISFGKSDITFNTLYLLSVRKQSLSKFIPLYTKDINLAFSIIDEIEHLCAFQERLFIQYLSDQVQTKIKKKDIEEVKLRESLPNIQKILDHTPIHINLYDLDKDQSIFNNGAGEALFGHSPKAVMESKFSSLWVGIVHPDDREKVRIRIENFKKLKDNEIDQLEYRMIDKSGNIVWYYSRATVFKRVDGEVKQVLLNGLNITGLKQVEQERNYIESQLKEAQKIAHIGNYDWDLTNDIINFTDEAYRIFDFPKEESSFKYSDFRARLKAEDVDKFEEELNKVFINKSVFFYEGQTRIILPDKTEKDLFSRARIIRDKKGNAVRMQGAVMEITNIKKAEYKLREKNIEISEINQKLEESQEEIKRINMELEERIAYRTNELQESEEQYRFLAENVPQMFWTARPDGGLDFHNKNVYTYTGATLELVGEWNWQNYIHPDDLPIMLPKWKESLRAGTTFETEFRIKRFDGVYRWHLVRTVPLKNSDGEVIKWMGSGTDIDEQKKYAEELKAKNEQLIKTNIDLDNFIYTASHDLKAPISNIEGLLSALDEEVSRCNEPSGDVPAILSMMETSVKKFKKTILDLTEITKAQKSGQEAIKENNLDEVLEDVKSMVKDLIDATNAEVRKDFSECSTINFSRKSLNSILYNLLSNALKFRSPQKRPQVFIKTQIVDNYIELSVKDNGQGFDPNQKEKIFDMFKRLQTDTAGSGVGLYLVKRIITNAGGKIEVESKKGMGSIFKVYFPVVESK